MTQQDCRCELLVRSAVGHVAVCHDCGQVHLTLQYMTMRFDMNSFRMFAAMAGQAQNLLDRTAASTPAPATVAPQDHLH